jgi:hypothetical protein
MHHMSAQSSIVQYDHFIPVSTQRLIEQLTTLGLDVTQLTVIRKLQLVLSFEFYLKLQQIKKHYQPINPDNELSDISRNENDSQNSIDSIRALLVNANFDELNQQQIQFALEKISPYGLKVDINFDAFHQVALFYRGKSSNKIQVRDWKRLFLKKKTETLISYQRLFLLIEYKDKLQKPGLHLKLFKHILRPDLEMLFPESSVKIKAFDKLKLILTGGGGTAGGLFATIGKISAAVTPWTIVIAVAGFIMLIWRQVSKIFIQKTHYMMTLAQNLYFHNMDNNLGAITYLIDLARQEEIKETILAYALLSQHKINNSGELDDLCEQWFIENFNIQIDFDIKDAIDKLRRYDLLEETDESLSCKPALESSQQLQKRWLDFLNNDSEFSE